MNGLKSVIKTIITDPIIFLALNMSYLKPINMQFTFVRKRAKIYVPDEAKDDRYWDKRCKNNFAARRSREARRLKENQIALRFT